MFIGIALSFSWRVKVLRDFLQCLCCQVLSVPDLLGMRLVLCHLNANLREHLSDLGAFLLCQKGAVFEAFEMVFGLTELVLLDELIDRLEGFQGPFPLEHGRPGFFQKRAQLLLPVDGQILLVALRHVEGFDGLFEVAFFIFVLPGLNVALDQPAENFLPVSRPAFLRRRSSTDHGDE